MLQHFLIFLENVGALDGKRQHAEVQASQAEAATAADSAKRNSNNRPEQQHLQQPFLNFV